MKRITILIMLLCLMMTLTGCIKPYQKPVIEVIDNNETAFLIPLEGDSKDGQAAFNSIEFLREQKVAAKRIQIPTRWIQKGRFYWMGEWLPTHKVIKVSRTPITVEWTSDPITRSNNAVQGLELESRDSIGFWVGATLSAQILEENASRFLYYYQSKNLSEIIHTDIRGYILNILSREFGNFDLDTGKTKKSEIFEKAFMESSEFFIKRGITINFLGSSQGINYTDKEIQNAINRKFMAENEIEIDKKELQSQEIRNKMRIEIAVTARKEAEEFAKAAQAQEQMKTLEINLIRAQATLEASKKWNGIMPANILPADSPLLFNLGK